MKKIKLTKGKYALVDNEDYEKMSAFSWRAAKHGYTFYGERTTLKNEGRRTTKMLHREIMETHKDLEVDHINGNGLDNRKQNLRNCTGSANQMNRTNVGKNNTTGVTGVFFDKKWGKYFSKIKIVGKQFYISYFDNKKAAKKSITDFKKLYWKNNLSTKVNKKQTKGEVREILKSYGQVLMERQ